MEYHTYKDWSLLLNETLSPRADSTDGGLLVLDLFAGCGGLALGFEAAGFRTIGYEMNDIAVSTYRANLSGNCVAQKLRAGDTFPEADVIIGGPPCQPFSVLGHQRGREDSRNGFPIFLDAVTRYRPRAFVFENVRGMYYRNKDYFKEIVSELGALGYEVESQLLNAKWYGVPQNRERVFVVGTTGGWEWPHPFVHKPVTSGTALGSLALEVHTGAKFLTPSMDRYIAAYERKSQCVRPRDLHLDRPSRTVTCRNLYGATSDMMRIRLPDGGRRMLSVREAARLQSFPDWFEFHGTEGKQFEQLGNAVPPLLAYAVASKLYKMLTGEVVGPALEIETATQLQLAM